AGRRVGPRRGRHVGHRDRSSRRAGRGRGARAAAARQPHVRHRRPPAAAVRDYRNGYRRGPAAPRVSDCPGRGGTKALSTIPVQLRAGVAEDATAIHALITANLSAGHLLPRTLEDIEEHAPRFVVAVSDGAVIGCGELARLSGEVAEVRSLVVDEARRGQRTGVALVNALADRARDLGYVTLCAFTHQPSHFVRLG